MKHPNQAALALHAGGDLGLLARWKTERHIAGCERCRGEVAAYEALRDEVTELAEVPELRWNRLAAEMRANIRLGLAAGECVRGGAQPLRENPWFTGARAMVAAGSVAVLLVTGLVLQRPAPRAEAVRFQGLEFQSTSHGVQAREGAGAFRLLHGVRAQNVVSIPGAGGSISNRFMDPLTDQVTVINVAD